MFRTRDFILVFTTVVFLLTAIGATIWKQGTSVSDISEDIQFVTEPDAEYVAEIYEPQTISREEKLAEMRRKIAEGESITMSAPEIIVEADEQDQENTDEVEESEIEEVPSSPQLCSGYTTYSGLWPAKGIVIEEIEGVRVFYKELETQPQSLMQNPKASSSHEVVVQKEVLLQLPINPYIMPTGTCLKTDVVGIAQDGSLIRNNEAGLYGVFGSNTLIGYALDGFPIYGVGDITLDECGGNYVNGQYRYYLSAERDVVLNCFFSTPVNI